MLLYYLLINVCEYEREREGSRLKEADVERNG